MVKHIVFWKVTPCGDKEAHLKVLEKFTEMLENVKPIIPQIVDARTGYNFVEGDVFNICVDSTFNNREDLNTYIDHPEHLKIREYLNSVTYEKAVFDYEY